MRSSACRLLDNFGELANLVVSIVILGGSFGGRSHLRQSSRIWEQLAPYPYYFVGIVGVGRDAESARRPESRCVGLPRSHSEDGFALGQDAIEFARHDNSFKAALHGNDMHVGCGQHGWHF